MATVAAGETAGRNISGTRIDLPMRLGRGAVVITDDCYAIAWHPVVPASWVALPVALQHGPLHRSHTVLAFDDVAQWFDVPHGRLLVRTAEPIVVAEDVRVVGRLHHTLLDRIATTLRRAREAHAFEAGFARP
jgi:hypothetical protein